MPETFFLVIEGMDGAGKSVVSERLAQLYSGTPLKVMLTCEPNPLCAAGDFIRDVLEKKIATSNRILLDAFMLNRDDHLNRFIAPFLLDKDKRIVICDRYDLSSAVYQSDDTITVQEIIDRNIARFWRPDLTLLLEVRPEVAQGRIGLRGKSPELFENRFSLYQQKYHEATLLLEKCGEKVAIVDANRSLDKVIHECVLAIYHLGPGVDSQVDVRLQQVYTLPSEEAYAVTQGWQRYHSTDQLETLKQNLSILLGSGGKNRKPTNRITRRRYLALLDLKPELPTLWDWMTLFPHGALVANATLVGFRRWREVESDLNEVERILLKPAQWVAEFRDIQMLEAPIYCHQDKRLWFFDPDLGRQVSWRRPSDRMIRDLYDLCSFVDSTGNKIRTRERQQEIESHPASYLLQGRHARWIRVGLIYKDKQGFVYVVKHPDWRRTFQERYPDFKENLSASPG